MSRTHARFRASKIRPFFLTGGIEGPSSFHEFTALRDALTGSQNGSVYLSLGLTTRSEAEAAYAAFGNTRKTIPLIITGVYNAYYATRFR